MSKQRPRQDTKKADVIVSQSDTTSDLEAPRVSRELLDYMERRYQFRAPKIDFTERSIARSLGAHDVLLHFRALWAQQNPQESEEDT